MTRRMTPLDGAVLRQIAPLLSATNVRGGLNSTLRLLLKWRSRVLQERFAKELGDTIPNGPFKGLRFTVESSEGGHLPRKLGIYERSLHPILEKIIATNYGQIIDVGCAEGLYAVGLAWRMAKTQVIARDIDENAQRLCQGLAKENGVAERVSVGALWEHDDFDICRQTRTAVICDIEGAEAELLDPVAAPGLKVADILVECHPTADLNPGQMVEMLRSRFAKTHDIALVSRGAETGPLPEWAEILSDADRMILVWEWRATPTPWLWMRTKDKLIV